MRYIRGGSFEAKAAPPVVPAVGWLSSIADVSIAHRNYAAAYPRFRGDFRLATENSIRLVLCEGADSA